VCHRDGIRCWARVHGQHPGAGSQPARSNGTRQTPQTTASVEVAARTICSQPGQTYFACVVLPVGDAVAQGRA
jgi:hypothetical protein